MFFNDYSMIEKADDIMKPDHLLIDFKHGLSATIMILFFIPCFVFEEYFLVYIQIAVSMCRKQKKVRGFNAEMTDLDVTVREDLDPYFQCLSGLN